MYLLQVFSIYALAGEERGIHNSLTIHSSHSYMSLEGQTHYLYKRKSSFILHVKTVQRQEANVTGLYQKMFKMLDILACFYINMMFLILFHPPSISALFIEEEQHIYLNKI